MPAYVDENESSSGLAEKVRVFRARVLQHLDTATARVSELNMHAIRHELQQRNATLGAHSVRTVTIEQVVRELSMPEELLGRSAYLAAVCANQPFAVFTRDECDTLTQMYLEYRTAFAKLRGKIGVGAGQRISATGSGSSTSSAPSDSGATKLPLFHYLMHQFCVARRWYARARTFPVFRDRAPLEDADRDYGPIARLLRWDFVRSV
jgi:hypothetical protein